MQDPPEPFEPEKTGVESTGCSYGRGEPGVYVTAFAINHGGSNLMRRGRTLGEEHDHYVDVLLYNAPPGTAERLATVAGGRLR